MGRCLFIAAFTFVYPGIATTCCFSSLKSDLRVLIRYRVSPIATPINLPLAILALLNAKCMSDCSSCSCNHSLAIVADMLKTDQKLIAASAYEIELLHLPYTLSYHCLRWLQPVLVSLGDVYYGSHPQISQWRNHHDARFCRLCGQMPRVTKAASHNGGL